MSKQYGLIDPKANKLASKSGITKHAAFESDSDSDSADPKKSLKLEMGESQKRQARAAQAKALAEDPTIYQYDELYDDMDNKRKESKASKSKDEKKPKYIGKLLETADKRKKEQERRIERQVQKEREAEGEMYKDKESFVTSAYRAKLEELKKAEEEEKREEYLESIGDVTKQSDLGGFYRHIYSQKMGDSSEPKKGVNDANVKHEKEMQSSEPKTEPKIRDKKPEKHRSSSESDEVERARIEALKSKEAGHSKGRRYRKRHSEDEDNDQIDEKNDSSKKVHLQSNLDADSDFSIDSNSSSSESGSSSDNSDSEHDGKDDEKLSKNWNISTESSPEKKPKIDDSETAPSNGFENGDKTSKVNGNEAAKDASEDKKPKEPKIDIWKKRTVGPIFDAALQRYYERKAARESG